MSTEPVNSEIEAYTIPSLESLSLKLYVHGLEIVSASTVHLITPQEYTIELVTYAYTKSSVSSFPKYKVRNKTGQQILAFRCLVSEDAKQLRLKRLVWGLLSLVLLIGAIAIGVLAKLNTWLALAMAAPSAIAFMRMTSLANKFETDIELLQQERLFQQYIRKTFTVNNG